MADWKYIVVELGDQKLPIIFPAAITHSFMAGAMQLVMDTFDPTKDLRPKQLQRMLEDGKHKPTSAGFIAALSVVSTFGASESLGNLKSREEDASVINCMPYDNGRDTGMPNLEGILLLKTIELLMEKIKDMSG